MRTSSRRAREPSSGIWKFRRVELLRGAIVSSAASLRIRKERDTVFVEARGLLIYVEEQGDGQPLLLLHGFTGSHESWSKVARTLRTSHRLILVDLHGHGNTHTQTSLPLRERYRMDEVVEDLAVLMTHLGYPQFRCLGYSMGGRTALALACRYPSRVTELVLESASPGLASASDRRERRISDERLADRLEEFGIPSFVEYWEELGLFASQQQVDAQTRAEQRRIRLAQTVSGLAASLRGMGTGEQDSLWDKLVGLPMPVELVTGSLDGKFTAIADEMTKMIPRVRHHIVAGAGHAVHFEKPREYCDLVNVLLMNQGNVGTDKRT